MGVTILIVVVAVVLTGWYVTTVFDDLMDVIKKTRRAIMSEVQNAVDAVTARLVKVEGEVVNTRQALLDEIAALREQLGEGVDLSGLEAVATRLDDLNPDAAEESES